MSTAPKARPEGVSDEFLSASDLELAVQALESLAARYRDDAKRQKNPVREGFEKNAAECERLAERMRRFQASTG